MSRELREIAKCDYCPSEDNVSEVWLFTKKTDLCNDCFNKLNSMLYKLFGWRLNPESKPYSDKTNE